MTIEVPVAELPSWVGKEIGPGDWHEITQERVNTFADATGDHQWIHVDVDRAKDGPFGGTIAHGYLTLSMIPRFNQELLRIEVSGPRLNYGLNKVRFPHPVKVGTRIRCTAALAGLTDVPAGKQL